MARRDHDGRGSKQHAVDNVASHFLARGGLSFDFDAGQAPYDYQVAIGSRMADTLVGGEQRDYFWGLGGDDRLWTGAESDALFGDSGADVLVAGGGADRLYGGMDADRLYGGAMADALMGGDGDDLLDEGAGHGDLDGGAGNDTLVGGLGADAFAVRPGSGDDVIRDFTAGPGMFDHLALHDLRWEDLSFEDAEAGVTVRWDGGSMLLEGVRQADLAQDDFMFAGWPDLPPGTRAPTSAAPERATMSTDGPTFEDRGLPREMLDRFVDAKLRHSVDFRFSFAGDERYQIVVGAMDGDVLAGGETWDQMFGRDGNDQLLGEAGDDILQGDAGEDELAGGDGSDSLDGGMGADRVDGGAMPDGLMGGDGDDVLDGGADHDMLEGGMGNDTLTGGTGADAFIVDPDSGHDVVLDFEATGEAQGAFDHIALVDILPGQVSVSDTAGGALVTWDTDGDATANGSILLQGVARADLRQSDFMFNTEPGFVEGISTVGSWYIFPATV
ncbi:MAG: calcium-binding protein [Ramlibacter sp.]